MARGEEMPKFFRLLLWLIFATAIAPHADAAGETKRLALVIGNSTYEVAGGLPNAARDATAFGRFLSSQGFEVDVVTNASRREMASAVSRFSKTIGPQDVALLYFAGHGMQLHGENYLVGIDAHLDSELDVSAEALALSDVIGSVEKKAKIALFFLDACRNNPLANRLNEQVEGVTRSLATRGLAPVNTEAAGTMVAFAAAPGQVAADGSGDNSPFTTALIDNLAGPGLEIGTAFKRVIRDVRSTTAGKQSPQILSSLALEFYFNASLPAEAKSIPSETIETPVQPTTSTDAAAVEVDFRKALRINTARIWTFFLAKHKTGEQASMARQFLSQMQQTTTTTKSLTPEQRENLLTQNNGKRREIQLALASKGFDPGTADGAFGQKTRNALSSYQLSIGIAPTGYVTDITAEKLGLKLPQAQGEDGLYSSSIARIYKPEDFEGLETDPHILKAAACAPFFAKIYGRFQNHVYVLLKGSIITRNSASLMAKKCGGYLAAIGSAAENKFIASLMNGDQNLFSLYYDKKYGVTAKMGAWIGLVQLPASKEPKGGWAWENGEPLTYTNWDSGKPNEGKTGDNFGMFFAEFSGKRDARTLDVQGWDDMGPSDRTASFVVEIE
ncbi:caspase family protein [Rhizobium sp. 32-5/1]|uniref:caspase family protein n=1 Tax=Rhizobium sp. 32-5/1 TaxID=3019602 RepID=UPI00240D9422|nr:caspase family protein [Rhizobium sp. 32-5/1]WEZ84113.1 caspase family protein [Rhizobium sp. 32-5/1]